MAAKISQTNTLLSCDDEDITKKICRTCMSEPGNQSIPLNTQYLFSFEPREYMEFDIKTMLMCLTSLQIIENDGFPQKICKDCLKRLTDSFSFRLLCIKSDTDLKKAVNPVTTTLSSGLSDECGLENSTNISNDSILHEFLNVKPKLNNNLNEEVYVFDNDVTTDILHEKGIKEESFLMKEGCEIILEDKLCDNTFHREPELNIYVSSTQDHSTNTIISNCNSNHLDGQSDYKDSERINPKDYKYVCEECGKLFQNHNGLLKKHIARHSEIKPFKCEHCDKVFHMKDDLSKHLLRHSSKTYTCHSCGASFSRKDSLKTHSNIHLGIKPHACPHCPKRFLNAYNLQNHIRIHSNESPFVCASCSRAFKQRSALLRHNKIHKKS